MGTSEKASISDPKKHALEALERRFAATKAEPIQQQQKNNKRVHEKEEGLKKQSSSVPSNELKASDSSTPSSSKRGHFAFSDRAHGITDEEATGPTYAQLSQPIHENLLSSGIKLSSGRGSTAGNIIHKLLESGDSAQKYMQGSRSMKIDNWLLLDSFVQGHRIPTGARLRAIQRQSKCSTKRVSMQQHRKYGSLDLPTKFHNFYMFKPMHGMWKDYIIRLLHDIGKGQLAQCLLTADLHGAYLQVVECKVAAFIGASGIMIRETAETFGIIALDDKFRVVPKKGSVFIFQAGCWKVTLHGDKLSSRDGQQNLRKILLV